MVETPTASGHLFKRTVEFFTSLESAVEQVDRWGISRGLFLWILFVGLLWILSFQIPHLGLFALVWLAGTAPIWLLIGLVMGGEAAWVWYINSRFLAGRKPVLFEVKMPREIEKSPRAMEIALTALFYSSGETTFLDRGWKGQVRPFFSFEMASFGGEIHFYVWSWDNYAAVVQAALYAQYPDVEIFPVEDYASKFRFDPEVHECFATDWRLESYLKSGLNGSFEINAYPFATYVDFELDKDPKAEYRIDPLAQVLELMGSIQPTEQMWIQIVIRRAGKRGVFFTYDEDTLWKNMVVKEVEKVRQESIFMSPKGMEKKLGTMPRAAPAWRFSRMLESMERNMGKYPFEVGMRGIYINAGPMRGAFFTGLRWIWKPFGNPNFMTHLRPRRWHNPYDYPWQDFHDIRWNLHTKRFFDAYRRRLFFHVPWIIPTNIMTNEMLASIWHPVGTAVATPGIERIPATKAEAPANLPVK